MTSVRADGCVEFRFFRPNAARVTVAGDFNQAPGAASDRVEMSHEGNGWWSASARLNAGEYRFRYLADGEWFVDYAAYGIESGKLGWTSVLLVPADNTSKGLHSTQERLAA